MALKRIENSKQRLQEKIDEGKQYLKENKNNYDVNELTRLKNHLTKKKAQFERDIVEYKKTEDKNEDKIDEFENIQVEAEDITDDIEHYFGVIKEQRHERERQIELER